MYLNEAQVSLTGYVATQPVVRTVTSGASNVTMRVGWTPRRQDRVTGEWTDGNTSYVTVICWRKLATNAAVCLRKGDPVIVKGRLSVRTYEDRQGMQRTAVEVEAATVGHDLSRGVAEFHRIRPQTGLTAAQYAAAGSAPSTGANGAGAAGAGASAGGSGAGGFGAGAEDTATGGRGWGSGQAGGAGRDGDFDGAGDFDGGSDLEGGGDLDGQPALKAPPGLDDTELPLPSEPADVADPFLDGVPVQVDAPELEPVGAAAPF
jgi:single-strand DNA-binding protein